jgi:hypothetical protein
MHQILCPIKVSLSGYTIAQLAVGNPTVDVGGGILGVDPDRLVEVRDGPLVLPQLAVGKSTVVVGGRILGVDPDGLIVVVNRKTEVAITIVGCSSEK